MSIRRMIGTSIPPYFLGRPRRTYEDRYDTKGRRGAMTMAPPVLMPRIV